MEDKTILYSVRYPSAQEEGERIKVRGDRQAAEAKLTEFLRRMREERTYEPIPGREEKGRRFADLARELSQAAVSLAEGCWNMDSPVRALTVTALYLISADQAGVQLDLLGQADAPRRDRLERLDRTLDQIRAKYGRNAISPASSAGVCQGGVQEEDEEGATS